MTVAALACSTVVAGVVTWAEPGGAPTAAIRSSPSRPGPGRHGGPDVRSGLALVIDAEKGQTLFSKNPEKVVPIASITKLMTAMVVLDAGSALDEWIAIERADVDTIKHSQSRLPVKARLHRGDLIQVALMASDNRAASALARAYPGGTSAFVEAMNRKARELGMLATRFAEPTGLSDRNVSTAADLARLVLAARKYPRIGDVTTASSRMVRLSSGRMIEFHNTNRLVSNKTWDIALSKTGYIQEAGRCLVMEARIDARQVVIVLLNSWGKYTPLGDSSRIRSWMEQGLPSQVAAHEASSRAGTAAIK